MALLDFLAASIEQARARRDDDRVRCGGRSARLAEPTITHDGMTVHFARRHSDADEMIEELLEECKAPKSLHVVSSDHRVQRAARQHGAGYVDSEQWFAELQAARRKRDARSEDARAKPEGAVAGRGFVLGR